MTPGANSISVLIRTFNSAKALQILLPALKLAAGDEIIVVDSGSTDTTLEVAAAHGAKIIHAPPPFNYSKSLNLGFRAAINRWVHVLSSHSVPMIPDLLGTWRQAVPTLPPHVVVAYAPSTQDGRGYVNAPRLAIYDKTTLGGLQFCSNGNTLYRREAWVEMPFDESIRTAEDLIWMNAMLARGYSIAVVPEARTMNRSRYSLRYMFRKGYSDARAGVETPMSVFNLFLGLGSRLKRFLRGSTPVGNLLRSSAQHVGAYFGSQKPRDNSPGTLD